ncbi:MAG: phosphoribosyl-ATP diphosphatase [Chloroflexi bacterium]|nr:phosphoribosyl-ATP diphosphatase [Chloroflexota bacterium]MBL7161018.1 phosphoribosyl-ATP diphosphatase [Anaerolineales bacterium]
MIHRLFQIVIDRKLNPQPGSYTNALLDSGRDRIAQKVGEEAIEVVIASGGQGKQRLIEETADLIYHLWVLLISNDISLAKVEAELRRRHQPEAE